ncbi:MAG: hypothetical protein JXN65_02585 [Clostridia bacterium]|nr:hypothetical protein [Clostridia bacterium]
MQIEIDKLFTYVVKHDSGFAPNPFGGYCTLACCKPKIRKTAGKLCASGKSVWIIGLTPANKGLGNKMIYAMKVTEALTFSEYFKDSRFEYKKPLYSPQGQIIERCGDNIYEPQKDDFRQLHSMHSTKTPCGHKVNIENLKRDLSGEYVLISDSFIYIGEDAVELPDSLEGLKVGRGHKCNFADSLIKEVSEFLNNVFIQYEGTSHRPHIWKDNDNSWVKS